MKFRGGFVSNSSSSSYLCVICSEIASGYDMTLSDAGMLECKAGHVFCEEHKVSVVSEIEDNLDDDCEDDDEKFDDEYCDNELCPVCQMTTLTLEDFEKFLKTEGITIDAVLAKMKILYPTYEDWVKVKRTL